MPPMASSISNSSKASRPSQGGFCAMLASLVEKNLGLEEEEEEEEEAEVEEMERDEEKVVKG